MTKDFDECLSSLRWHQRATDDIADAGARWGASAGADFTIITLPGTAMTARRQLIQCHRFIAEGRLPFRCRMPVRRRARLFERFHLSVIALSPMSRRRA